MRVSELPLSSKYRSTPDVAVSDDEREDLTERLNAAFTRGDIDDEDYRRRLDTLYSAHRLGELVPVVVGLPPRQTYSAPAIVEQSSGQPGELEPSRSAVRPALLVAGSTLLVITLILALVGILIL